MSLRVLSSDHFTRTNKDGKTTFSTFASNHNFHRRPDSFLLEAQDGHQHLFKLTTTVKDDDGDTTSWSYRNTFYGDKVEAVIVNT